MNSRSTVVTGELHRVRRGRGKAFAPGPAPEPERRPARVALALALAHQIEGAIDRGDLRDQAEAARRLGLTRARLTQFMDLTLLAPDIQESILFLDAMNKVDPLSERNLRTATRARGWTEQRRAMCISARFTG